MINIDEGGGNRKYVLTNANSATGQRVANGAIGLSFSTISSWQACQLDLPAKKDGSFDIHFETSHINNTQILFGIVSIIGKGASTK